MTNIHELVWNHAVDAADYDTAAAIESEDSSKAAEPESYGETSQSSKNLGKLSLEEFGRAMILHL